jgi:hypothetical protein
MDARASRADLAADRSNVPEVYYGSHYVRDGGLLSYGVDRVDTWRRVTIEEVNAVQQRFKQALTFLGAQADAAVGVVSGENLKPVVRNFRTKADRQRSQPFL